MLDHPESCGFQRSLPDREADLPSEWAVDGPDPHDPWETEDQVRQGLQKDIKLDWER